MRRLRSILLNIATVLSLLLCAATLVLWARGEDTPYWMRSNELPGRLSIWGGTICFGRTFPAIGGRRYFGLPATGPVTVGYIAAGWRSIGNGQIDLNSVETWNALGWAQVDGLVVRAHGWDAATRLPKNVIPYRVLVGLVLPLRRFFSHLRASNRRGRGLCPSCGYDLRATPQGGAVPGVRAGAVEPLTPLVGGWMAAAPPRFVGTV